MADAAARYSCCSLLRRPGGAARTGTGWLDLFVLLWAVACLAGRRMSTWLRTASAVGQGWGKSGIPFGVRRVGCHVSVEVWRTVGPPDRAAFAQGPFRRIHPRPRGGQGRRVVAARVDGAPGRHQLACQPATRGLVQGRVAQAPEPSAHDEVAAVRRSWMGLRQGSALSGADPVCHTPHPPQLDRRPMRVAWSAAPYTLFKAIYRSAIGDPRRSREKFNGCGVGWKWLVRGRTVRAVFPGCQDGRRHHGTGGVDRRARI